MTTTFDRCVDAIAAPFIAFELLRYRFWRFVHQPMTRTLLAIQSPCWLAELLIAAPLLLLGILLPNGETGTILGKVLPVPAWMLALILVGGSHLFGLLWGSRRVRLISSIFEPWIYACLLIAFGGLSASPRVVMATFVVSFAVSVMIPFTLRDRNGSS